MPSMPTAYDEILSPPRSVTISARPSGVKPTCAPSGVDSGLVAPSIGTRSPSTRRKPVIVASPVFSTKTRPSCSATLRGAMPVGTVLVSSSIAPFTAKTLTSLLATFVTSRWRRSRVSVTEPCDGRWALSSPAPPVANSPVRVSEPSAAREKAITSLWAAFVWTKTAPSMDISMSVPLPFRSGRGVVVGKGEGVTRKIGSSRSPPKNDRRRLLAPVAERGQEHRLVVLGNLLLAHHPAQADGLAQLLEIRCAAVAQSEVFVHTTPVVGG